MKYVKKLQPNNTVDYSKNRTNSLDSSLIFVPSNERELKWRLDSYIERAARFRADSGKGYLKGGEGNE